MQSWPAGPDDPKERAKIDGLHRLLPLEHSMPTFMSLLGDKVQAILQLASLIAVMLGKQDSVQVQRRMLKQGDE